MLLFARVFAAKVRRLYDIANVLRSLKLIEKVHVTEERGRKPAFEWVGLAEFPQVKGIAIGFFFFLASAVNLYGIHGLCTSYCKAEIYSISVSLEL